MPPNRELTRKWFCLAHSDLESARHLLRHDPPLVRSACFHAQQTVEKALKGVLLLNDQRPPRTHSLADLFGLCKRWLPGLSKHEDGCEWLTACAVQLRYPDSPMEVTRDTGDEAVAAAERLLTFVLEKVPAEVRP